MDIHATAELLGNFGEFFGARSFPSMRCLSRKIDPNYDWMTT